MPQKVRKIFIFPLLMGLIACTGPRLLNTVTLNPDRSTQITRDLAYGDLPRQKLDMYTPDGQGPFPVLIFIHGGGWERGSKGEYAFAGKRFASEGFVTAVINYRLYPEVVYPSFMEDVGAAVVWVYKNADQYGGNPAQLFISGHSAGAYNAVQVAVAPEFLAPFDLTSDIIDGVAGIAGPYDFYPFDPGSVEDIFGPYPNPEATQPVNRVTPQTPPMILIIGEEDESIHPRNLANMKAALEEAGVRVETRTYPSADHAATVVAIAWPNRYDTVKDMVTFFKEIMSDQQ